MARPRREPPPVEPPVEPPEVNPGDVDPGEEGDGYERTYRRPDLRDRLRDQPLPEDFGGGDSEEAPWENPRPRSTRRVDSLVVPMITGEYGDAETWRVEAGNAHTGRGESLGYIHIDCTSGEFIQKFLDAMPNPGEEAVTFRLTAYNKAGTKWGGEPAIERIPWNHVMLQRIRAASTQNGVPGLVTPATGESAALRILQEQMTAQNAELLAMRLAVEASREKADKVRDALVEQRIKLAQDTTGEMTTVLKKTSEVTHDMYAGVSTMQTEIAKDARDRERADRESERERIRQERADEKAARDSELALKLAMINAEAAAGNLRVVESIEKSKIEAAAKLEALKAEAREREESRKDERADRARQDAAMESARAERAEAEEKRREEHALAMENLRKEARSDEAARLERQRTDDRDYALRRDALMDKQIAAANATQNAATNPLGAILDMVAPLGLTPLAIMDFVKGLSGGGATGGVATVIAEALKQIGEVIKTGMETGAIGAGSVEEAEEEVDPAQIEDDSQTSADRARQVALRAAAVAARKGPKQVAGPVAGGLDMESAMPKGPAPETVAVTAAATLVATAEPAIDLTVQREGRKALEALWNTLIEEADREKWRTIIVGQAGFGNPAGLSPMLAYLTATGCNAAFAELDIPADAADAMAVIVKEMGVGRGPKRG